MLAASPVMLAASPVMIAASPVMLAASPVMLAAYRRLTAVPLADPPDGRTHAVRGPCGGPGPRAQPDPQLGLDLRGELGQQGGHCGLQAARPGLR